MRLSARLLAASGTLALVCGMALPAAAGYPAKQCFKVKATGKEYCSAKKLKSHAEGAQWVAAQLKALGLQASAIGKPYLK